MGRTGTRSVLRARSAADRLAHPAGEGDELGQGAQVLGGGIVAVQLLAAVVLVRETLPPAARVARLSYVDLVRVMWRRPFLVHAATVGLNGAGSAMLGFMMFSISAAVTPVSGLLSEDRPEVAMAAVMTAIVALAATVFALEVRSRR